MSSFIRNIQRASSRMIYYNGRGSRLGTTNPNAPDRIARIAREARNELRKFNG